MTGGCRGLGFAFAEALAGASASIAIIDVGSPDQALEELRNKYSAKFEFYRTNVTDREQVENTVQRIEKDFGSVDIK